MIIFKILNNEKIEINIRYISIYFSGSNKPVMERIESSAKIFLNSLLYGSSDEILFSVTQFKEALLGSGYDYVKFLDFDNLDAGSIQVFQNIQHILKINFNVWTVSFRNKQNIVSTSFSEILEEISKKHLHTIMHKNTEYKCTHHHESLLTHLLSTMLIVYCKMKPHTYSVHAITMYCLTGLLHDIGKLACARFVSTVANKWISYPFHGEMGSGLLLRAWNTNFEKFFTKNEWTTMARTIHVHMYGYHATDPVLEQTKYKWNLLCSETSEVKDILYFLSQADHFGAIRNEPDDANIKYIDSRKYFKEAINQPCESEKYTAGGIIVAICGPSGAGKSTIAEPIKMICTDKEREYVHINRDNIMIKIVADELKHSHSYTQKISDKLYATYKEYYEENKLGFKVNQEMKRMIQEGLEQQKIIIIDSTMNMYRPIESIYPTNAISAFKIGIHCIRNEPIDLDQDQSIDERTIFSWLPSSVVGESYSGGTLKMLTPTTSTMDSNSAGTNISKPNICFTTTWTCGTDELYRQLNIFIQPIAITENVNSLQENMNAEEYVNFLYKKVGWNGIKKTFGANCFDAMIPHQVRGTEFENKIFKVKYQERCNLWKPKWSREFRGTIIRLTDENIVVCDKNLLQRGAEVLTGHHLNVNINETQDVSVKKIEILDDIQNDTCNRLLNRTDIDAVASFKLDGSLLGACCYRKGTEPYNTYCKMIDIIDDKLAKITKLLCDKMNLEFIVVISSQNTLFLGEDMQDHMITAILVDCGIPYEQIKELAKTNTPAELFQVYGHLFLNKLNKLFSQFNCDKICSCYEAVNERRTTAWGNTHKELTVDYPKSILRILGCTFDGIYKAHFQFEEELTKAGFEQPLYWKISHATQIENLMKDLTRIIHKEISVNEFFDLNKPNNIHMSSLMLPGTEGAEVTMIPDYEGFVFYREVNGRYDYSKIKTEEYYKSHKFHEDNVSYLIRLGKVASDIFPLTRVATDFYLNLEDKLKNICDDIHAKLNSGILFELLPEKAQISYHKQKPDTQMKMLINAGDKVNYVFLESFKQIFPRLEHIENIGNIGSTMKGILMNVLPWAPDSEVRISQLVKKLEIKSEKNPLKDLFGILYELPSI